MQRVLLTCATRAVVTTQEEDLGVTMDSSLKLSTECAEAAKMLSIMRKDIEAKTEGIILPFHETLMFSCLEYHEHFCSLHPSRNIGEL